MLLSIIFIVGVLMEAIGYFSRSRRHALAKMIIGIVAMLLACCADLFYPQKYFIALIILYFIGRLIAYSIVFDRTYSHHAHLHN